MSWILLQSRTDVPIHKLILLLLAILAVVAVGFIVVQRVKRMYQAEELSDTGGGFTLSDLRELHKAGKMSNEEFERAKGRVIEAAKRAAERDAARAAEKEKAERQG